MNIYLVFVKYNNDDPSVDIHTDMSLAIDEARNKLYNQSNMKSAIREFEVVNCSYFGINLGESMMAWVEEREIAPKLELHTSSATVYSMDQPPRV